MRRENRKPFKRFADHYDSHNTVLELGENESFYGLEPGENETLSAKMAALD